MSSYARAYLSQLAANPYKQQIMTTLATIVVGITLIMIGYVLLEDQKTISNLDDTKTSDFNKILAWITIVLGGLAILYTLYSVIKG